MSSNQCSHLLPKMEVSRQAPLVGRWLNYRPQPAVTSKMAQKLDGGGHDVVVRNGKEERLGAHRSVSYEFNVTQPCEYVEELYTFFYLVRSKYKCTTSSVPKDLFTCARSRLTAKDSSSSPFSLRASRP